MYSLHPSKLVVKSMRLYFNAVTWYSLFNELGISLYKMSTGQSAKEAGLPFCSGDGFDIWWIIPFVMFASYVAFKDKTYNPYRWNIVGRFFKWAAN